MSAHKWTLRNVQLPPEPHKSKLTPDQRSEIRERLEAGEKPMSLAVEYGVSAACIRGYRS